MIHPFPKSLLIPAFIICMVMVWSCAHKYAKTNRVYKKQARTLSKELRRIPTPDAVQAPLQWVGTTNFSMRKPSFVIIHHTAQNSCDQTLRSFTLKRSSVSAHYVICKDGTVHRMLNDYLRAWHAGAGKWGNLTDINSASIGIELDNNGFEPFPASQMQSLIRVLDTLKVRYGIPDANFIGHLDIAPARKIDPNVYFPWKDLAEKGFGLWYSDTSGVFVPEHFNHLQALRLVGYDLRDTMAAIRAFKRHFVADTIPVMNEQDRKILYSLVDKYY